MIDFCWCRIAAWCGADADGSEPAGQHDQLPDLGGQGRRPQHRRPIGQYAPTNQHSICKNHASSVALSVTANLDVVTCGGSGQGGSDLPALRQRPRPLPQLRGGQSPRVGGLTPGAQHGQLRRAVRGGGGGSGPWIGRAGAPQRKSAELRRISKHLAPFIHVCPLD